MHELFKLFSFTLFYYQLDNILKPCLYNKVDMFQQDPILFYPVIQSANIFILSIFSFFTIYLILFSNIKNYTIYALSLIYIKYVMDTVINNNAISIYQYEFRRTLMWLFTTPLILKLYCDMNNLTLLDVNSQYHIISNILHILLFPFRKTHYNSYIILILSVFEGYFIYKLFEFKQQKYTKFIIYIWSLFSFITFVEVIDVFNVHDIQICYLLSDMIAKLTTLFIVNDYEEQMFHIKDNIDLQSISLITSVNKSMKLFETNTIVTPKCKLLIQQLNNKLLNFIPTDKTILKLELLKKILPFELEDKYLTQSKDYKPYPFICVLFTDIVSYTELAKNFDDDVIYKLLNDIHLWTFKFAQKYELNISKFRFFIPCVYFVYRNSVKNLDYFLFLYIDNLVFLSYVLLDMLSCRCLMNHCGLYSTHHNRSYIVVAREPTAFHHILFPYLDFLYSSLVLVLDFFLP